MEIFRAAEQKSSRAAVLLLLLMIGCSSQPKYMTKVEEVKIVPKPIEKELPAKVVTDTLVLTNEIVKNDTITLIKYFPIEKKFYVKAKPDTIRFYRVDTLIINNIKTEQKEKIDYKLLILSFALGIIFTIIILRRI